MCILHIIEWNRRGRLNAAVVRELGQAPVYTEFPDPVPRDGEVRIAVLASAISRTTKSRASGAHYDSAGPTPFVPGIDGVGLVPAGGRVFFLFPRPPYGSLAQSTVVPFAMCLPLPERISSVNAAAIANPGLSSWAALTERANLRAGETVLINGGTGVAGSLAVRVAKHLGAKKVIVLGRDPGALERVRGRGADVTISLLQQDPEFERSLETVLTDGVDVVLDYVWGTPAERLLVAAARYGRGDRPLRYVQIGSTAGSNISLPSAVLRSSSITLMGSGTGGISPDRLLKDLRDLFEAAVGSGWEVEARVTPLKNIAQAWANGASGPRSVIMMESAASGT